MCSGPLSSIKNDSLCLFSRIDTKSRLCTHSFIKLTEPLVSRERWLMELDFYCIHDNNGKKIEFQMVALAVEMRVHPPLDENKREIVLVGQGHVFKPRWRNYCSYSRPISIRCPRLDVSTWFSTMTPQREFDPINCPPNRSHRPLIQIVLFILYGIDWYFHIVIYFQAMQ